MTSNTKESDTNLNHNIDKNILLDYTIHKRIGKGAYGIVYKAYDKNQKRYVAIKKIYDAFRNKTDAQRTYREILFLKSFKIHPNIITMLDMQRALNNKDLYVIFEFMENDLNKVIRDNILKDIHVRYIMFQLCNGLDYIHKCSVMHRDLKPCNILIDKNCSIKIGDLGLARSLCDNECLTEYIATRWYRAPEILMSNRNYSQCVDIWSLGCILAEMLLCRPLFPGSSTSEQLQLIVDMIRSSPPHSIKFFNLFKNKSEEAVNLLIEILVLNPHCRPNASKILEHPFIKKYFPNNTHTMPKVIAHPVILDIDDNNQLEINDYQNKLYQIGKDSKVKKLVKSTNHEMVKNINRIKEKRYGHNEKENDSRNTLISDYNNRMKSKQNVTHDDKHKHTVKMIITTDKDNHSKAPNEKKEKKCITYNKSNINITSDKMKSKLHLNQNRNYTREIHLTNHCDKNAVLVTSKIYNIDKGLVQYVHKKETKKTINGADSRLKDDAKVAKQSNKYIELQERKSKGIFYQPNKYQRESRNKNEERNYENLDNTENSSQQSKCEQPNHQRNEEKQGRANEKNGYINFISTETSPQKWNYQQKRQRNIKVEEKSLGCAEASPQPSKYKRRNHQKNDEKTCLTLGNTEIKFSAVSDKSKKYTSSNQNKIEEDGRETLKTNISMTKEQELINGFNSIQNQYYDIKNHCKSDAKRTNENKDTELNVPKMVSNAKEIRNISTNSENGSCLDNKIMNSRQRKCMDLLTTDVSNSPNEKIHDFNIYVQNMSDSQYKIYDSERTIHISVANNKPNNRMKRCSLPLNKDILSEISIKNEHKRLSLPINNNIFNNNNGTNKSCKEFDQIISKQCDDALFNHKSETFSNIDDIYRFSYNNLDPEDDDDLWINHRNKNCVTKDTSETDISFNESFKGHYGESNRCCNGFSCKHGRKLEDNRNCDALHEYDRKQETNDHLNEFSCANDKIRKITENCTGFSYGNDEQSKDLSSCYRIDGNICNGTNHTNTPDCKLFYEMNRCDTIRELRNKNFNLNDTHKSNCLFNKILNSSKEFGQKNNRFNSNKQINEIRHNSIEIERRNTPVSIKERNDRFQTKMNDISKCSENGTNLFNCFKKNKTKVKKYLDYTSDFNEKLNNMYKLSVLNFNVEPISTGDSDLTQDEEESNVILLKPDLSEY